MNEQMNEQKMASPRSIDRRKFMQLCAGSLALAAVGCDLGGDRSRATPPGLTVLYPIAEWGELFTDSSSQFLLFLPLVTRNAKGELEGRLADRWEHSPDYRTWTIHLRKDVRWHDGVPVTAHDVKFTLDLLSHPARAAGWVPPGAFSITVLDDSSYAITYHKQAIGGGGKPPGAGSPLDDYTVYYPRHLLEKLDPREFFEWEFWTHPVGNGPYRYVRHVPRTMMEFEANPDYYKGRPRIARVVLKFFAGEYAPLTELLAGNVDALVGIEQMDLLKLAGDSRFRPYHSVGSEYLLRAIVWNQRDPLFHDRKVRRALTLAINRRELHRALNLPEGIPIFDVIPPERQFQRDQLPEPLPYDPELAKRLLDEAGWRDTGGDGVRGRDGEAFRFAALAAPRSGLDKAVVYIQAQLRRVGIQMDVQTMEFPLVRERVKAGKFQAAMFVVNQKLTSPVGLVALFGENSPIGYANSSVIALLKKAQATVNPDEIDQILRDLMPIFQADLPVTFLYPNVGTTVASRRIRGLSSPYRADPVEYMEELWVEEDVSR